MSGMTEKNSTIRGRVLGLRLRHYRVQAGLAERGAAAKLGVSTSTICRIERGTRNPTLEEVASLVGFYDVKPDERAPLIEMAREVEQRGWSFRLSEEPHMADVFRVQEARAFEITGFEPILVPGLLQSDVYLHALMSENGMSDALIAERAHLRVARRHILFRDNPVRYLAIINEAALHQTIGSAAVMHRQLDYMIHLASSQNVIIRIIPIELSGKVASYGISGFHMLKFAESPTLVHSEGGLVECVHEDPQEIREVEGHVHQLSSLALSTTESFGLISRLMHELEDDPDVLPHVSWPQVEDVQPQQTAV